MGLIRDLTGTSKQKDYLQTTFYQDGVAHTGEVEIANGFRVFFLTN